MLCGGSGWCSAINNSMRGNVIDRVVATEQFTEKATVLIFTVALNVFMLNANFKDVIICLGVNKTAEKSTKAEAKTDIND